MKTMIELNHWRFTIKSLGFAKEITLPHTWNVDDNEAVQLYRGEAGYETEAEVESLSGKRAILYFGCAYHTARVYVNGQLAGTHTGSGYTPFAFDVTGCLVPGKNQIQVLIDNSPKEEMLPHQLDYDWADDGGLTRNVVLSIMDEADIAHLAVTYTIDGMDSGSCSGVLHVSAETAGEWEGAGTPGAPEGTKTAEKWEGIEMAGEREEAETARVLEGAEPRKLRRERTLEGTGRQNPQEIIVEILDGKTRELISSTKAAGCLKEGIAIPFAHLRLWSPESPNLYVIQVRTETGMAEKRIGLRTIAVEGGKVLLNGKALQMKGCEWMPGSHPDYGMAEPLSHSIFRLSQLKAAGCNFTRFHWQQDTTLFDWCDENGLLVQEEIPFWGYPKKAGPMQLALAKKQADAMVRDHAHHPSIICWGVGNELGGEFPETIEYVKEMHRYFYSIDGARLVNYVSNSVSRDENVELDDATMYGDIAMWNEYLGLWQPCDDVEAVIKRTYAKFGHMPSMVTEFGLCEPAFSGGDERRIQILKERIPIYKSLPNMCGYVWFSLNDYRTHCGEYGEGKWKQRIHGSTDLYGKEKPSYGVFAGIGFHELNLI